MAAIDSNVLKLAPESGAPAYRTAPHNIEAEQALLGAILRIDPRSPSVSKGEKGVGDYTIAKINKYAADGDSKTFGDFAMANGAAGYLDGGTLPVGEGPVPWQQRR